MFPVQMVNKRITKGRKTREKIERPGEREKPCKLVEQGSREQNKLLMLHILVRRRRGESTEE